MEPTLWREDIARDADAAAKRFVETGRNEWNPHPNGSDVAAVWKAAFERYLLRYSAPLAEGSA